MARIRKRALFAIITVIVIIVLAGGYFVTQTMSGRAAQSADSTSDSTVAENDTTQADGEGEDEDKKKEPDPVPVEIATVRPRQISSYHYTTATLEPERQVDILAKIAGEITRLHVEEGDVVKAGDVLCQFEDTELKIALDEARINRDRQKREFDRLKEMLDEKIISQREFHEAEYNYDVAVTKFDAAKLKYNYTKIKAPFGGVITKRHVERGQNLAVGGMTFELVDPTPLLVRMYLPENEIRDIHVGQLVSIQPDNDPTRKLTGKVIRIAPEVDVRTGTVKVTAETHGEGMPGSFARIKIVTDTREGSLTIPRRGLISDAGDLFVYVAESDSVRKAPINIGYQDEEFAEVLDGVVEGDSVVVVGVGGLRTGTKIKVLDPILQDELSKQGEQIEASN